MKEILSPSTLLTPLTLHQRSPADCPYNIPKLAGAPINGFDTDTINIYVPNIGASKYQHTKGEIDSNSIIVVNCNTTFTSTD